MNPKSYEEGPLVDVLHLHTAVASMEIARAVPRTEFCGCALQRHDLLPH